MKAIVKHEWRKTEKGIYLPKSTPELVTIPKFKYLSIHGEGNPTSATFTEYIQALYSLAYAIKMTLKKTDVLPEVLAVLNNGYPLAEMTPIIPWCCWFTVVREAP
ncbi:hypothetical protein [Maribacter sp.]|uniref:hypothetical protein n=1 Tax=Maribacter sp. TaxID=1897614 RepID=UPI0025C6AAC9|nr:hypothetical protein [Maribacter sp.]